MGSRVNARFEHLYLVNYCVRVNADAPISQQPLCRSGILVSGNIKIMRVFAGVPEKSDFKRQWGRASLGCFKKINCVIDLVLVYFFVPFSE